MLQHDEPPPMQAVLAALIGDLHAADVDLAIVLDDYHVIESTAIQEQVVFLVEHLPPRASVAIATRADPAMSLPRFRARGELVEIRAADLRFRTDEAAAFLREATELELSPHEVAALEERTEGWVAALQLAALSLQGRDDATTFIDGFTGNDRYVVDYLVEEVLERQPQHVRSFLIETSILGRLTGPLCDALTGRADGRATLEALDRGNVFVIPLDNAGRWYRYHQLFADVLRARLLDERPADAAELHRRAAAWFEEADEPDDAIRHALAGRDHERAARLIELALPELRLGRQEATMRRLLGALPPELLRNRPVLAIGHVGALMANGEMEDIDQLLTDAERWLDPETADRSSMVVVDAAAFRQLPAAAAMYRAAQAQLRGDREGSVSHARRALDLAGEDDPINRGGAAGFLALERWSAGDLEAAHAHWTDAMASLSRGGHSVDAISIVRAVAEIRIAQGRLREARSAYDRGLELAAGPGGTTRRGAADLHTGLAELALERNELDAAADHLLTSAQLEEQGAGLPQNAHRRRIVAALVRLAEGDAGAAIGLVDDAEQAYVGEYFPVTRPIPAVRARVRLAQRRLADATDWLAQRGLTGDDELDYLTEYEHVTLARILIARSTEEADDGLLRDAVALLDRLLASAEAGGRQGAILEVLILQALAWRTLGDESRALASLRRALSIGRLEGYVRTFVGEGAPMMALLESAVAHGIEPEYARHLLAQGDRPRRQPLDEPLSQRELEVLRLLGTDLDGPDIARELVVGLSTVRSHTKAIYAKLGVNSRRAAVRRGEELGLMGRSTTR
jgi:LuxR family maltose regulon positive regulatory protein